MHYCLSSHSKITRFSFRLVILAIFCSWGITNAQENPSHAKPDNDTSKTLLVRPDVSDRPNIILIMSDDQGYGDAGYTGHPFVKTPNLDAMAKSSVVFSRFYAAAPVCSPTRASVLTGRHPVRVNVPNHGHYLRPRETTLAEALKGAGYVTGHFGKWHIGSVQAASPTCPGQAGFDRWLSGLNFFDQNPFLSDNGTYKQMQGQGTVLTMDATLEFLQQHKQGKQPMFAVCWFPAPHDPHEEFVKGIESQYPQAGKHQGYYQEITLLDQQLGRLRQSLVEMNIAANTIVWFCSDNGGLVEAHSGGRAKKGSVYEGGLRVPAMLEWPAKLNPMTCNLPATTSDIYPTLLASAGVEVKSQLPLDGIDLTPALHGQSIPNREIGFWHHLTGGHATWSDRIIQSLLEAQQADQPTPLPDRLLKNSEAFPDRPFADYGGHAAWLEWPWKLHRIKHENRIDFELYHLVNDPQESDNLAESEPARTARMSAKLEAWQRSVLVSWEGKDVPHVDPIRVACIGDSITYGSTLNNRDKNQYPVQLGHILGSSYDVKNFGVSGATLLSNGDIPWIDQPACQQTIEFRPDIVVINLGANDTKPQNIGQHESDFVKDYLALIQRLRQLPSKPLVYICDPVEVFGDAGQITQKVMDKKIRPRIREVAIKAGCNMIDLDTPLKDRPQWVPDKVHPNDFGAEVMAHQVADILRLPLNPRFDIRKRLMKKKVKFTESDFHGFREFRFQQNGVDCRLVMPHVAAQDQPWVWRARFFDHEPQFDIAMLQRGWHVAYCDVSGQFGSPTAVKTWNRFYRLATSLKLDRQPFLEGMSRGGLIIYNWANANPKHVLGIYGDNPVCDGRSWPGGKGLSKGDAGNWQELLKAYRIDEKDAQSFTRFPIDGLKPLAKAGVPILHIVGMADKVVPVSENTAVLVQQYRDLGGHIDVIEKPDLGHHPHSLPNPKPIVDFAIRCWGKYINPASLATPSAEYRGGFAGWGGGTWWGQLERIKQVTKETPDCELVFLGDSITQNWTGHFDRAAKTTGNRPFDTFFSKYKAIGMGISGDRTEHLSYRVENGAFASIDPKAIVLMIGVNNLIHGHSGDQVAEGTRSLVKRIRAAEPKSKIILLGCFPTGASSDDPNRQAMNEIHQQIGNWKKDPLVVYVDMREIFIQPDGSLNPAYVRNDHVHLKPAAYKRWAEHLQPILKQALGH